MKINTVPLKIYQLLLHLFPTQFRKQYLSEILDLITRESEDSIQKKKKFRFWVWLFSDYLISIIQFYITGGAALREKKLTRGSVKIFVLFGSYYLFLAVLNLLRLSSPGLPSEVRRIIAVIPWYADFFLYILFFFGMVGFVILLFKNNLPFAVVSSIPIFIAVLFKPLNTLAMMFSYQTPFLSNYGKHFISFGMLTIGIYLIWKKFVPGFQLIPFLLIGFPLLGLIEPLREIYLINLILNYSNILFGLGWILLGVGIGKFIDDINRSLAFSSSLVREYSVNP